MTPVQITEVHAGDVDAADGWVHRKCIPYAIIVQATHGSYTVRGSEASAHIAEHEVALVAAGTPIVFTHHGGAQGRMRSRWLHLAARTHDLIDPCALYRSPQRIGGPPGLRIGELLRDLVALAPHADGPALAHDSIRLGLAYQVLGLALQAAQPDPRGTAVLAASARLGPLSAWLAGHLHEPIDITALARHAGCSRSRLHALCRELLGCSPMAHLKQLRLAAVARLLLTSDDTLGLIAEATGFRSSFHLSREFARRYGLPPSRYRERQRLGFEHRAARALGADGGDADADAG